MREPFEFRLLNIFIFIIQINLADGLYVVEFYFFIRINTSRCFFGPP